MNTRNPSRRLGPGWAVGAGVAAALLAAPAHAQLQPAPDGPMTYPRYRILRADDDFSYLRNDSLRAARPDPFNPLKYVRLGPRPDRYWSVGGEARLQYELFRNERWGDVPPAARDDNGHLLQRYMLHADLHLGPRLRLFGQLHSTHINGRRGGPRPFIDQDRLDVYQVFADLRVGAGGPHRSLTLRLGRQELDYGSERLLTMREGPNTRLSFDAARLLFRRPGWQLDAFAARPVQTRPGAFDDRRDPRELVWAAYAVHTRPGAPPRGVDFYYIGQEREAAGYYQGAAGERRHSLGARLWSNRSPFGYDVEVVGQAGRFGAGRIRAFYLSAVGFYHLKGLPLKPRLVYASNLVSGDRNPADPNLQTFNPLYPRPYFGLAAPIGPLNLVDVHPGVQLHPAPRLMLQADVDWLWRLSRRDAVYSPAVTLAVPPASRPDEPAGSPPSACRYMGAQLNLELTYQATPHWLLGANYAHFPAGPFLRAATSGQLLRYYKPTVTFKF